MPNTLANAASILKSEAADLIDILGRIETDQFLKQYSHLIDTYFQTSFVSSRVGPQLQINKNPYAIIAMGGYGREEQCVHSDIDLLILFHKKIPPKADQLVRESVYPLWDLGFEVGYATRSLKECLSLAAKEYEILIPLLDARFICGVSHLYSTLLDDLRKKVVLKHKKKIIRWLVQTNLERHRRFGDSSYRLEPNLKEGRGGLRDYHTMLWLARIEYDLKQARDLEYHGDLSHDEYRMLQDALAFIWNVRNRLHLISGRKYDQLHFETQISLAAALKFKAADGQQPVERFLGRLHSQMEFIKNQLDLFLFERGYTERAQRRFRRPKVSKIDGLEVKDDMIGFRSLEGILNDPVMLLQIFEESARLKIPVSAEALRIVREFGYLIKEGLQDSARARKSFERILLAPAPRFNVLKGMLSTGLLSNYIPEFESVVDRVQYDEYHLYPVDLHLLTTVQTLKRFKKENDGDSDPLYGEIYRELKQPRTLLWAALLHDIGKGDGGKNHSTRGAEAALRILTAKKFKPKAAEDVAFLIQEHLYLIKTATRRDIHDESTAIECARRVKDPERLKMLYLLTVADSMSTGPNAWNDWTATLLKDLFLRVLNILEYGELASREVVEALDLKQAAVRSADGPGTLEEREALFKIMSPRYLMFADSDRILEDIELYRSLQTRPAVWRVKPGIEAETRTVTICAKDRPGLFSMIAGVFTLNGINILDAQVFTWQNQVALDIFKVTPPPDRLFENDRWDRAQKHLQEALEGRLDLADALGKKISNLPSSKGPVQSRPHQVNVDNTSSSFFTLVEVFTYDFPGLLYRITDTLYRSGLDIWVAKIATKADQVVDVFYVRDFEGQKIDSEQQVQELKAIVLEKITSTRTSAGLEACEIESVDRQGQASAKR